MQKTHEKLKIKNLAYRDMKKPGFEVSTAMVSLGKPRTEYFESTVKTFLLTQPIDLKRKDYYFYFSSYNANVSKDEFLYAVEKFKTTFIKNGNPETSCVVKEIRVNRDSK